MNSSNIKTPTSQLFIKSRESNLDIIRCVATILVVGVHCNGYYFHKPALGIHSFDWLASATFASLCRICVPLFFILSGYLLLRVDVILFEFCRKRLRRIVLPLLFWSAIYLCLRVLLGTDRISLPSAVRLFYNAEVYYHLGFLYSLVAVYVAIPILAPLAVEGRRHLLVWFCAGAFIFSSIIPFCDKIMTEVTGHPFHCGMPGGVFWGYLGYAVAGALISGLVIRRRHIIFAVFAFVTSTTCTTILSIRESLHAGEPTEAWMGYNHFFVVIASLMAFVSLLPCSAPSSLLRPLRFFTDCSFGVYLSHPLVMELLGRSGWHPPASNLLGLPVYVLLVCGLSIVLVSGLRLLPLGRSFV